jgi:large subunit ribosomal protein L18
MDTPKQKAVRRQRRHRIIRKRVRGTPAQPRLTVYRSNKHIYAQVIDDLAGHTLAAASSQDADAGAGKKGEVAKAVGKLVAERARSAGVETVSFDRGGFRFHGRIKALADAARETGLKF